MTSQPSTGYASSWVLGFGTSAPRQMATACLVAPQGKFTAGVTSASRAPWSTVVLLLEACLHASAAVSFQPPGPTPSACEVPDQPRPRRCPADVGEAVGGRAGVSRTAGETWQV